MEVGRIKKKGAAYLLFFAAKSASLRLGTPAPEPVAQLDGDEGGID
jgi:hypothetical protein